MLTSSFGHSMRRNQHCINLRSCLGCPVSFVLNQLEKYDIRDCFLISDLTLKYQVNELAKSEDPSNVLEAVDGSTMFNDTMRLRSLKRRTSLSAMNGFSKEEPTPRSGNSGCGVSGVQRPREPPPPPPPVASVLLPVTPPRKFLPSFSEQELKKINSVIVAGNNNDVSDAATFQGLLCSH